MARINETIAVTARLGLECASESQPLGKKPL